MQFVCYAEWRQLPASADSLFTAGAEYSVFCSRQWFENLQNTLGADDQSMLLACVVEGEEVLAILPLMTRDDGHLFGLTHLYTALYSLLLAQHNRLEIVNCLVDGLNQMSIASLRLHPVATDDRSVQLLQQAMEETGYECHRRFRFYNWIHRVQGQSFREYLAMQPAQVRNTIARKKRKLEREHGYVIRLYTDRYLQRALDDYNTVYRASWKAHEQFDSFIEGLVRSLSPPGWLRLAILYVAEKPAAAQLWFVAHGKASIFKLAYDQAWKRYSPGSILIAYLMEQVIERDQVEEIDFRTGNDLNKPDWMSERRERWAFSFFKPGKPGGKVKRTINPLKALFLTN